MFTKLVTPVAACAAIVALGGPIALSQRPALNDGAPVVSSQPNVSPGGARVLQGDPPPLPGVTNAQPTFPQSSAPQAADVAPQMNIPRQNAPRVFNAQPACPYGDGAAYVCDYDRQWNGFAGGGDLAPFAQPPVPGGFYCAGGACPFEAPQANAPAYYLQPW